MINEIERLNRLIRNIPYIIHAFKEGTSMNDLARQQNVPTDAIESIIRLYPHFNPKSIKNIKPIYEEDE